VTGASAGAFTNSNDLDGVTTIRSVPIALPAEPGDLSFRYVFAHGPSSSEDGVKVWVEDETATRTLVWSKEGTASTVGAAWVRVAVPLTTWAGTSIRIVIEAADGGPDSLVEVLIDDIRVERHVA
jgi:aminopeptidase S